MSANTPRVYPSRRLNSPLRRPSPGRYSTGTSGRSISANVCEVAAVIRASATASLQVQLVAFRTLSMTAGDLREGPEAKGCTEAVDHHHPTKPGCYKRFDGLIQDFPEPATKNSLTKALASSHRSCSRIKSSRSSSHSERIFASDVMRCFSLPSL